MAKKDHFGKMTESWQEESKLPWSRMRYATYRHNLSHHIRQDSLRILDVGGGTGEDAIHFAKQGHLVTLLDCSEKMLETAKQSIMTEGVIDQVTFLQVEPESMLEMVNENSYDLILCHMMIEFVSDVENLLARLCDLLVPGGLLSIVDTNRFGDVYMEALQKKDLATSVTAINQKKRNHPWVNRIIPRYAAEDLLPILEKNNCQIVKQYGLLNLCAYLPNEPKFDPEYYQKLLEFELKLSDQYPYYLLARFFQLIVRKI